MNPIGIDLLTTLPEMAENSSVSTAETGAAKGDFLSEFMGMLFAEPQSEEQLQLGFDGMQETVHSTSVDPEVITDGLNPDAVTERQVQKTGTERTDLDGIQAKDDGQSIVAKIKSEVFSQRPESGWVASLSNHTLESDERIVEPQASRKDLQSSAKQPTPRVELPFQQPEAESKRIPFPETERIDRSQLERFNAQPPPQKPGFQGPVAASATDAKLPEKMPDVAASDAKKVDPSVATPELSGAKIGESLRLSPGRDQQIVNLPAPLAERDVPNKDETGIRLMVREAGTDTKPVLGAYPATGENKQRNATRHHTGQQSETHEEQLLRRLTVSRSSSPVENTKAESFEPDPLARIQAEPDKTIQSVGRAPSADVGQFSEVLSSPRPEVNPLPGNERVSFHEPQAAKEMLQGQTVENFDRIVDQIVKRVSLMQKGETIQLGVRLKPEFLGELRIETIMEADRTIRAVIHAEDSSVKALLEGKVASLVQRFEEIGIHVDKVEIQSLLSDVNSGTDSGKNRQGLDQPTNGKSSQKSETELREQAEEASEEDIDDGHIHLFI